jgi:hypothetical protein
MPKNPESCGPQPRCEVRFRRNLDEYVASVGNNRGEGGESLI